MNKIKLLIPIIFILLNSGCASIGPTVRIETPEPAEDFAVICEWFGGAGIIAGSGSRQSHKVFITESGKEVDCGLGFSASSQALIMHPLYTEMQGVDEDGIRVVRPKHVLQILDEQKAKFEAGYWDKYPDPGYQYANNLVNCGLPPGYLDYYNEIKKLDKEHFKQLYHKPMLECLRRKFSIINKYNPQIGMQLPEADDWMKRLWESEKWNQQ